MEMFKVDDIINIYEKYVSVNDVDNANFFIAIIAGLLGFMKYHKVLSPESVAELAKTLRIGLIEGPNYLNPYVMELLGILEEEFNEALFNEFLFKLKSILREERLDRLEV
jgi:hypothetical protein